MRRYIVEFVVFMVYVIFNISWVTTGVLQPKIIQELGLSVQQASLFTDVILFAKIFGAAFTGFLIYRFGLKYGYLLGCILISAGILQPFFADSYIATLAIRFLVGLGSACSLICLVPVAQQWFSGKSLSVVLSVNMSASSIGGGGGIILTAYIIGFFDKWQDILAMYGYINLSLLFLWFLFQKKLPPIEEGLSHRDRINEIKVALKSKVLWGMIVFYIGPLLFINSAYVHLPTFFELYSPHKDVWGKQAAIYVPTLITLVGCITPYFGSYLRIKGVNYKLVLSSCIIAIVITFIGSVMSSSLFFAMLFATLAGMSFGTFIPFLFGLPSEMKNATVRQTSYIFSCFWAINFALAFCNSQLMAHLVDITGSYKYAFMYLIAVLLIFSFIAMLIFPKQKGLSNEVNTRNS